ncbi:MFS transporter [Luteolibacter flavescens]|uniref:MFS transporter n=1 Tax=Luteolibacter flavescens TaxID=1859460 RepID=A0ABT3FJB0_9BACT|nr:MFS transporter [Luteolibacter flavescens]MCW1883646.1 MFS transporter [Luteolibacter flavescens]
METQVLTEAEERAVISKVTWRLIPLLFTCYIIAYIDRINVGFAKPHLEPVLGVDPKIFGEVFGTGAGLFFIGYFIFEVPSNLILQKVGARLWIARIMIVWGIVSMGFIFLNGKTMFYVMRFLLGAAEAGFFPGVILYLTFWFPARERARTVALFALGGVAAGVIGSPISGALLEMDGFLGFAGWRWMFFIEALPAILLGIVVLLVLPNRPSEARWLTPREKDWLQTKIANEARGVPGVKHRLSDAFRDPRVWLLCLLYFLVNVAGYGYEFWLPTIVRGLTGEGEQQNNFIVGLINMVPYLVAGAAMILAGKHSDRTGERRFHVAVAAAIAAGGATLAAFAGNPWLAMLGLVILLAGQKATLGPFWALGTAALSGTAAAGGIALINSVGNLGGYFGPRIVGMIKDQTQSDKLALLFLGGALLALGAMALALKPEAKASQD